MKQQAIDSTQHSNYHAVDTNTASLKLAEDIYHNLGVHFVPEPRESVQRFPAPGKDSSNTACWVFFHPSATFAVYGCYITDQKFTWRLSTTRQLTPHQSAALEAQIAQDVQAGREQREGDQKVAAKTAENLLSSARPANVLHQYLTQKLVSPHNLKQSGVVLFVPLQDTKGKIWNAQKIYPDCSKSFLKGGRVKGLFATVGCLFSTDTLYICEGWATAATIHEETGHPVIVAMFAGNLLEVCQTVVSMAPTSIEFIVAADNDHRTEGNPGLTKGREAAEAIGASIVSPPLPCQYKDCRCTDFNDYANCFDRETNND
ncbi:toprim domain-containing protein [Amphritea sp. HPY]|uniref:toprim domain-containing protein n=1 Tax=Amphritea sp. HPY TaxID=3421652 RepID=UPI003D7E86F3